MLFRRWIKQANPARLTAALGLVCMVALSVGAAHGERLLKGKVTERDRPVRIQRPSIPKLAASADETAATSSPLKDSDFGDFGARQFLLDLKKQEPQAAGTANGGNPATPAKAAEAESDELIIAWEAWHKRVSTQIFTLWRQNAVITGVAHTTVRVTRARHIEVLIQDVQIDNSMLMHGYSPQELEEEFIADVKRSVEPLEGSPLLDFPEKSERREVSFSPYFRASDGPSRFSWERNDYEHVNLMK